jgi:hypothetical protein
MQSLSAIKSGGNGPKILVSGADLKAIGSGDKFKFEFPPVPDLRLAVGGSLPVVEARAKSPA